MSFLCVEVFLFWRCYRFGRKRLKSGQTDEGRQQFSARNWSTQVTQLEAMSRMMSSLICQINNCFEAFACFLFSPELMQNTVAPFCYLRLIFCSLVSGALGCFAILALVLSHWMETWRSPFLASAWESAQKETWHTIVYFTTNDKFPEQMTSPFQICFWRDRHKQITFSLSCSISFIPCFLLHTCRMATFGAASTRIWRDVSGAPRQREHFSHNADECYHEKLEDRFAFSCFMKLQINIRKVVFRFWGLAAMFGMSEKAVWCLPLSEKILNDIPLNCFISYER